MPKLPAPSLMPQSLTPAELLERATGFYRGGHVDKADDLYRKILVLEPDHGRALYYLGLIASQADDLEGAAELMSRGLKSDPDHPSGHNNLGTIYQGLGRVSEAKECFKFALTLNSSLIEAHFNLGSLYQLTGFPHDAEVCYRKALACASEFLPALNNLGVLLREQGHLGEAMAMCRRALDVQPYSAEAHNNIGILYRIAGEPEKAIASFTQAIELNPELAEAHHNMGSAYRDLNQLAAAGDAYKFALSLKPDFAEAHNNMGVVLQRLGKMDMALACFDRALSLKPEFPDALANKGLVYFRQGRLPEAMRHYEKALEFDSDHAEAKFNMSEIILLNGKDMQRGWQAYEMRWAKRDARHHWRNFPSTLWQGQDIQGKTILVWGEQGVGEEIMFASMIRDLQNKEARVLIECEPRLVSLFRRSFEGCDIIPRTDPPREITRAADISYHVPIGNLGRWLRPDGKSFNAPSSFLIANHGLTSEIRETCQAGTRNLLVGVSWQSGNADIGREKSVPLRDWLPILKIPGVTFIDLQYGDTAKECGKLEDSSGVCIVRDSRIDQLENLDDFASQVAAMDLVISVSNTAAHMAGGLGVPTWIMLSAVPLWKWFSCGEESPWYSSVRLFRQRKFGEWANVIEGVRGALVEFTEVHGK